MLDIQLRVLKETLLFPFANFLKNVHPTTITLLGFVFGIFCVINVIGGSYGWALMNWSMNRILDGLDGTVARLHNKQTDLGGYLDILCDFAVYSAIPVGLVVGSPSNARWLTLSFLLSTYFVNAASLFHLAAILEKRAKGAKLKGELTTVTMPDAGGYVLIEGTETVITYSLFILFPHIMEYLFFIFGSLVVVSTLQRLYWAVRYL